MNVIKVIQV